VKQGAIRLGLVLFPAVAVTASLFVGRYPVGLQEVIGALLPLDGVSPTARVLILDVRLPRALGAALVGASLALSGAVFQGIFRNPLVDSRILGVSSGAAFGAALALLLGIPWYLVDAFAFGFGLLAVFLVVLVARRFGNSVLVLVISGILVGSLFSAFLGMIKYVADPLDVLPAITFWLLGSLSGTRWDAVEKLLVVCVMGAGTLLLLRWRLNLLTLDEREAAALGVNVTRLRTRVILVGTLLVASAVSQAGMIGWIGLITPHAARALTGPDHSRVLPASMLMGAGFLVLLDLLSRTLMRSEIPLGILTGIVGVPAFLLLFMRHLARGGGWR